MLIRKIHQKKKNPNETIIVIIKISPMPKYMERIICVFFGGQKTKSEEGKILNNINRNFNRFKECIAYVLKNVLLCFRECIAMF